MDSNMAGQNISPTDPSNWTSQDFPLGSGHSNVSPTSPTSPSVRGMNYLKSFSDVQKKVTRDGQPPKRRGPKPDSKPAQTRRQELNRQAQRTHRERKEQYMKALETEMSRLRERYGKDTVMMRATLDQQHNALAEQRTENIILKDILNSHGITFQAELDARKASLTMQFLDGSFTQANSGARSANYGQISPTAQPTSSRSPHSATDQKYGNGRLPSNSGTSASGGGFHGHSSAEPGVFEQAIKREPMGISDMPGIFERNQQLGIDFILSLEATCRDHGEYLVRRSVDSPDTPEEAQFSGHALMACCPPPTHISNVPAKQGGLQPTYPHQVPDIPAETLNTLLNLSQQIAGEGHIEGGQVTPIMAIQHLKSHPQYLMLTAEDVKVMTESVKKKVRCYGFGAVMEDFELRDALHAIFASKYDYYGQYYGDEVQLRADDL